MPGVLGAGDGGVNVAGKIDLLSPSLIPFLHSSHEIVVVQCSGEHLQATLGVSWPLMPEGSAKHGGTPFSQHTEEKRMGLGVAGHIGFLFYGASLKAVMHEGNKPCGLRIQQFELMCQMFRGVLGNARNLATRIACRSLS